MKKFVNTYLYASDGQANSEGYKCFDISNRKGKRKFVKEFGIGTVIEPKPKKFQKIPQNNSRLNKLIYDIVEIHNEQGYLMFFSDTKSMAKTLIKKLKGHIVDVNAEWLEKNDPEMLDWIVNSQYWGRGYDYTPGRENAIIELQFNEGGVDYYADFEGSDSQDRWPSQNQPPWGSDSWEDWGDMDQLKAYYMEIKKA